jgi:hypothetical protein
MVQLERRHYSHDVDATQETFQRHQQTRPPEQKLVGEISSFSHRSLEMEDVLVMYTCTKCNILAFLTRRVIHRSGVWSIDF